MTQQSAFGGNWTQDKLERLKNYLNAYVKVFKNQTWAETIYVDAFAGTGSIPAKKTGIDSVAVPFLEVEDITGVQVEEFLNGSARIALEIDPPFGKYLFIESSAKKITELEALKQEFADRSQRIEIVKADANAYLMEWINKTDWRKTRAVVFLDPCGMQVEWRLLEVLAATKSIDLWLLVPIGMGVNRLLTHGELPPQSWQDRLTLFFGTDEWLEKFYTSSIKENLFGFSSEVERVTDYKALEGYFVQRLNTLFDAVAPNPLTQRNSKNSPMFMLCFAAHHPKAVEIAKHILSMKPSRR